MAALIFSGDEEVVRLCRPSATVGVNAPVDLPGFALGVAEGVGRATLMADRAGAGGAVSHPVFGVAEGLTGE